MLRSDWEHMRVEIQINADQCGFPSLDYAAYVIAFVDAALIQGRATSTTS